MISFISVVQKIISFLKQFKIRRIFKVVGYLLAAFGFVLIVSLTIFSSRQPFSHRLFAITSSSMRPEISMGSLVLVKPQNRYRVGDVITFRDGKRLVTHRILFELPDSQFQTKGDANSTSDRLPIAKDQIIGRVAFSIPRLGRLLMLLKTKIGVILLVVVPGAMLIWQEINLLLRILGNLSNKSNLSNWSNWTKFFRHGQ